MSPSKIFLLILLCFLAGIFISSFLNLPELIICEILVLGIFYSFLAFFFREKEFKKVVIVFGVCLMVLGFGIFHTERAKHSGFQSRFSVFQTSQNYSQTTQVQNISPIFLPIEERIFPLKEKLKNLIYQNFSPPQSSILVAILLGEKRKISSEWKEKLNKVGVRHITAISGMHIVILSGILLWLGMAIGLSRGRSFYFALFFLWLFIFITGTQPSAFRAGVMGSMFLFCQKIGRERQNGRALLFTAVIILAFNPLLLRYNIGFQLSFLATLGIIYLLPVFRNWFDKLKFSECGFGSISELLSMTFAAQIFTLPILIYNFGFFSLVSPLSNLLIVPILPYLMGFGFLFLLSGLIYQPLSFLFSLPIFLLLSYLISTVNFFCRFKLSSVNFQISWHYLIVFYLLLAYFLHRLFKKSEKNRA